MVSQQIWKIIKKIKPIVAELFMRRKKHNISTAFISQFYFEEPKNLRINVTKYFAMKIFKKKELQQITLHHSFDIEFKDFVNCVTNVFFYNNIYK